MISSEQRVLQPENPRPVCPTVSSFEHLARKRSICTLLRQVHCHLGQQKNGRDVFAKTKPFPSCIKPKKADQSSSKRCGEMLVSIVWDRPLDEAKALVEDPDRLMSEITAILESKQAHPLLHQMVNPDVRDDVPIADFTAASSSRDSAPQEVPHKQKCHRMRRSPCMGSAAVLATVSSSNQVGRKDLTPMAVLELRHLISSRRGCGTLAEPSRLE